jgi:hypothetical protein
MDGGKYGTLIMQIWSLRRLELTFLDQIVPVYFLIEKYIHHWDTKIQV